jgi:hypothetical protein
VIEGRRMRTEARPPIRTTIPKTMALMDVGNHKLNPKVPQMVW